jgi:hypothetical protein
MLEGRPGPHTDRPSQRLATDLRQEVLSTLDVLETRVPFLIRRAPTTRPRFDPLDWGRGSFTAF